MTQPLLEVNLAMEREQDAVRAFLYAVTRDRDVVDELQQEVAVEALRSYHRYDPARPLAAWLIGIARNVVLRWRQESSRARRVLAPETVELIAAAAEEVCDEVHEQRRHLVDCIAALPDRVRSLLEMRYFTNLPMTDIAARLGRNLAEIEMSLVRLRRALRRCVERRIKDAGVP